MATICRYCMAEVSEREIEAEDGCCPECGAMLAAGSGYLDDEEDFEDDFENEEEVDDFDEDEDNYNDFEDEDSFFDDDDLDEFDDDEFKDADEDEN